MQNTYISSLIFAFLTTLSVTTIAAPSIKPEAPTPITAQISQAEQSATGSREHGIAIVEVCGRLGHFL